MSCCYHGTAPKACTVLRISRPYRDALPAIMLLSRHCAQGLYRVMHIASLSGRPPATMLLSRHCAIGLYRVLHIASLSGRPTGHHTAIMSRPVRDETLHNTVQEDKVLAVP